ncbi:hypothetical protein ACIBBD_19545 [Streptomyces sp. NPDC051315]|uniref:hypothetical protein n=1 Tax=Streptomyces sp. NPDC051315 TaxID=3365650 RepID=UPI0037AEEA1B
MHAYELQQFRSAELIRRAEDERLAREVARGRRAARREAAERAREAAEGARGAAGSDPHTHRHRRPRPARTT